MMRRLLAAGLGATLLMLAGGCDNDSSDLACVPESTLECGGDVRRAVIDTGQGFELDPGGGVGVFVEYEGDGRYRVSTTCDSAFTGYACYFDLLIRTEGGEILDYQGEALEDDGLDWYEDGALGFRTITEYDHDAVVIDTEPGSVLSVDVLLDCGCGNAYLFWIGDGAIHAGAPSNPLEFEPSAP